MKVSELSGPTLNEWVARALGLRVEKRFRMEVRGEITVLADGDSTCGVPHYSSDWREAGPILERQCISIVSLAHETRRDDWVARIGIEGSLYGPTPLIAAMRAFVSSRFGDEVPEDVNG
jgi:hypothetical protein